MANFVFNIAKGRVNELARNVDTNSPTNSALILIPFNNDGSSTDDTVQNTDDVAAVEALTGVTERTANGWNRKTLVDTDVTVTVDDSGNAQSFDIPDQSWTVTADTVTDLLLAYDADTGAGTDSNLIPLCWYDFSHDGSAATVTAVVNAGGAFSAA